MTDDELIQKFLDVKFYTNNGEYIDATYFKMKYGLRNDSVLSDEAMRHNNSLDLKHLFRPNFCDNWKLLMRLISKIMEEDISLEITGTRVRLSRFYNQRVMQSTLIVKDEGSLNVSLYKAAIKYLKYKYDQI